ncbi:1-acyl-sn-glycerol-3-phosphate acyltransferase [Dehalococcoidia bacterium]|nr:1-acyl-sn-glycerol-3-phosphate acyltransferase [Dehalococcoidia bacterium]
MEAVSPRGRLIVVANHQSNADPPVLAASLPRQVRFMAKRGLFRGPIISALMRAWGVHPLERNGRDAGAVRWMLRALEQEQMLAIFPEGTRSPNGMRKANRGVAFIALRSQTPILPIGITGTEKMSKFWRLFFPFCRIKVKIGQPFSLPIIEGQLNDAVLDSLTEMIMLRVAALLPEGYRGVYGMLSSRREA